jgi:hypothetical protein
VTAFALVPRDITRDSYLCGIVGGTRPFGEPQQVESCFFAAYQQCRGDKMQYDTLENELQIVEVERDFIIDNHCGIAYVYNSYTAACASLQLRADGLHFMGCGADGDILVPSAPPGSST